jgi:GTP-binding protein
MTSGPLLEPSDYETEEALEAGRKLFAMECKFFWAAANHRGLPPPGAPEVAFAGRSNVGKSSLLNALTGRKALARSSQTPGRTQEVNFFNLGDRLTLVDLPGYGYAKAPKTKIAAWTKLVFSYLQGRAQLNRICLLIDSRHGMKDSDREVMAMLDRAAVAFQIVLTKADKTPGAELQRTIHAVQGASIAFTSAYPVVVATSADTGLGIAQLRSYLAGLALPS